MQKIQQIICVIIPLFLASLLHAQDRPDVGFYAGIRTLYPPIVGADLGMVVPVLPNGDFVGEVSWLANIGRNSNEERETTMTFDFLYQWRPLDALNARVQWNLAFGPSLIRNRYEFAPKPGPTFPNFFPSGYSYTDWYIGSSVHNTLHIPMRHPNWYWQLGLVTNFYFNNSNLIGGEQPDPVIPYLVFRGGILRSF
jgi:hypothetical protein